jgi:hypothetical protein
MKIRKNIKYFYRVKNVLKDIYVTKNIYNLFIPPKLPSPLPRSLATIPCLRKGGLGPDREMGHKWAKNRG